MSVLTGAAAHVEQRAAGRMQGPQQSGDLIRFRPVVLKAGVDEVVEFGRLREHERPEPSPSRRIPARRASFAGVIRWRPWRPSARHCAADGSLGSWSIPGDEILDLARSAQNDDPLPLVERM